MSTFSANATVQLVVSLSLTEKEARALAYLAGFDPKSIAKALLPVMGERQVSNHSEAIVSFFSGAARDLPHIIERTDKARLVFFDRYDIVEKNREEPT